MKTITSLFIAGIMILLALTPGKACIPAAPAPVFQTIDASANALVTVTNMPTGNVLRIIIAEPGTRLNFNFCVTNTGTVPSGTNDGFATILDVNGPSAQELAIGDDGCANVMSPGYGPPVFEFVFPAADTFYLYLTEYDPSGSDQCFGNNGSNANFDAEIDIILPPDFDVSPIATGNAYTRIPLLQATQIPLTCDVVNIGKTTDLFNLYADVFKLPNTTTPEYSQSLLMNSVNQFSTVSLNLGTFAPSSTGDYLVRYITTSAADLIVGNDTGSASFTVTNDVYARDMNAPENILITGTANTTIYITQKFEFPQSADIPGVYLGLFADTNVFFNIDTVRVEIYAAVNDSPTTLLSASSTVALNTLMPNQFNLIPLPQTLMLQPGTYFFGFYFREGSSRAGVGSDSRPIADRATWFKGSFVGNTWNPNVGVTSYVRPRVLPGTLVGIENALINQLMIYPNPAKNQLFVLAPSATNEAATISLHSIDGRMVYNENIETNKNHTIDVSSFATGVYFVKLQTNQSTITERVVIE